MKDATSLMRTTRGLSQKRIRELMNLSADLAKLNPTATEALTCRLRQTTHCRRALRLMAMSIADLMPVR